MKKKKREAINILADQALLRPQDNGSNIIVETINVSDLENGIWRETADEQEDWDGK